MPRRLQRPSPAERKQLPRYDLPDDAVHVLRPIGVVRSPYVWREEAPRQATIGEPVEAVIVLRPGLQNAVKDLEGFDRIWALGWCHHSKGWRQQIVPPRDRTKRGLFATRAPDRPNPIILSALDLVSIFGTRITVRGCDFLDGTPILDLKPYIPAYDAFPESRAGWVDGLVEPGPDHRGRRYGVPARKRDGGDPGAGLV